MIKSVQLNVQHRIQADKLDIVMRTELDFSQGIIGIYGGSGQGKSTLLKLLARLIDAQQVQLDWQLDSSNSSKQMSILKQKLAAERTPENSPCVYQPQDVSLFETMTVAQNLAIVNKHSSWRELQTVATTRAIEVCGIEHLLGQSVASLSGGEKQRVALARSLLSGKPLLLLDEPFSALDWQARIALLRHMHLLQQQTQLAVIMVSHSLTELAMACQTLLHVEQGQVVQHGQVAQLLPKLVGLGGEPTFSRLLVAAPTVFAEHQLVRWQLVESEQWVYAKSIEATTAATESIQVTPLLVRADKVSISLQIQRNSSVLNQLEGRISSIIRSAPIAVIELDIDGQRLIAEISSWSLDRLALVEGQSVFAQFKAL